MKDVLINLRHANSIEEFHKAFGPLGLPKDYGYNLDALHDVLTSIGEPTHITLKSLSNIDPSYTKIFLSMVQDAVMENKNLYIDVEEGDD
jgi:RNAse (barnase) inhibitor barstar